MPRMPNRLPESPTLTFRTWQIDDLDLAMSLWGDPRVTALIDARSALGRDAVETRLRHEVELEAQHGVQYWPAFLSASGDFVGCAGLRPRDAENRIFELGFHLCARFWGKGLATEAARAVARFAFDELGASALFAGHNPNNAASARVLAKLGFRHTHDEHYAPTGLLHPSYLLSREDFVDGGRSRNRDRIQVRLAVPADLEFVAQRFFALWPDGALSAHRTEAAAILSGDDASMMPLVVFVALVDGELAGLVEVGLRSHADGCDPKHAVGFIEGWYVDPAHRRHGVGRALIAAAEDWARSKGCNELASDTWIDNEPSQRAHDALGFEVVDRCVHYRKSLGSVAK